MTWNPTSPVSGGAQTGFTSPTYSLTLGQAPDVNGKQYVVSTLGGTQAGVDAHSVSKPFTMSFFLPKVFRFLGTPNPVTGVIKNVARNVYKQITRKGVVCAAGQVPQVLQITTTLEIPSGAETYDVANVKAAISAHIGMLSQQSAGIGDTANQGTL